MSRGSRWHWLPAVSPTVVGSAQLATGVATVLAAPRLARAPWAMLDRDAMVGVVRVLGVRQTLQGLVTVALPRRQVLLAAAGVDALHALSLTPVLVRPGPYRRQAAGSAGIAVAAAVVELAAASRTHR